MKKLFKPSIIILVTSSLLISSCSNLNSIQNEQINQNVYANSVTNVRSDVYLEKSIIVSVEKASVYGDTIKVASSFSQFTTKTNNIAKYVQSVTINQLSPQLITLSSDDSKSKTPMALSVIANPQKDSVVSLSPQTTAEALIFMDPNIATTDIIFAEKEMNIIKNLSETKDLVNVIESRIKSEPDFLYKDNQQQNLALSKAVNSVVNRLADEYNSKSMNETANRVSGVEIKVNSQNQSNANLELNNYQKRMVQLYFENDNSGNLSNISKENLQPAYDLIDFSHISFGFKPVVQNYILDLQKPINKVEVIGLGLKDANQFKNKWSGFTTQDKLKYGLPIAKSLMSDFISPVISIIVGFNVNKVYQAGLFKILGNLPFLEIVNDFNNKQYEKAFKALLSGTIKALLDKNGALLRELLQSAGLNLSDAVLARMTGVIGIFNLVKDIIEVIRTLYAYSTTNIIDSFKVNNNNGKLEFLKSDTNK
ncbi:MAG: hypothetical protein H7263_06950 [Candidatus Sericytochromatia bacterium]|nr:hypothetical protein [Candidatus Sericytochromatia bacterium]